MNCSGRRRPLQRLAEVATNFERRVRSVSRNPHSLYIYPKYDYGHRGLVLIIRRSAEVAGAILFEVRAEHWIRAPTRARYVRLLKNVLAPILKRLEAQYGIRASLSIGSSHIPPRILPPATRKYFHEFARVACGKGLGFAEWQAFYQFILYTHAVHVRLSGFQLFDIATKEGFAREEALALSTAYRHGRQLLRLGYSGVGSKVAYTAF